MLVTNVIESMKWSESKQLAGYIFACCIALAPSSPLLAGFGVQSLLAVSLCQLASTEDGNSWEYGCAWYQLRILSKKLGRGGWRDYWCFLTSSSCCSHRPTILLRTRVQSNNIRRNAAWLPVLSYLQACKVALIGRPLGLSTLDNNNSKN